MSHAVELIADVLTGPERSQNVTVPRALLELCLDLLSDGREDVPGERNLALAQLRANLKDK